MTDSIRSLVNQKSDAGAIKREATLNGMRSLRDDGAVKVLRGVTSIEEVMRVTSEDHVD